MTCHVSYVLPGRVMVKGTQPKRPARWTASAWFILPDGSKHKHSCTVHGQTAVSLAPIMGALIDSLVADVGDTVTAAGWEAYCR